MRWDSVGALWRILLWHQQGEDANWDKHLLKTAPPSSNTVPDTPQLLSLLDPMDCCSLFLGGFWLVPRVFSVFVLILTEFQRSGGMQEILS